MTNETFRTTTGATIAPRLIDGQWRLIINHPDGTVKVGKTEFSSRTDALDTLRQNSVRQ